MPVVPKMGSRYHRGSGNIKFSDWGGGDIKLGDRGTLSEDNYLKSNASKDSDFQPERPTSAGKDNSDFMGSEQEWQKNHFHNENSFKFVLGQKWEE